jgi:hypothetical protein
MTDIKAMLPALSTAHWYYWLAHTTLELEAQARAAAVKANAG